jgi:hypothetical protein
MGASLTHLSKQLICHWHQLCADCSAPTSHGHLPVKVNATFGACSPIQKGHPGVTRFLWYVLGNISGLLGVMKVTNGVTGKSPNERCLLRKRTNVDIFREVIVAWYNEIVATVLPEACSFTFRLSPGIIPSLRHRMHFLDTALAQSCI